MDKYVLDDSELSIKTYSPVCFFCKHLRSGAERTCDAFPDDIPIPIWNGDNNHKKAYQGDKGIRFEKRNDSD